MKNTLKIVSLFMLASILIILNACEKDEKQPEIEKQPENYNEISLANIIEKETTLSDIPIPATDINGHILDNSDVIIYKTSNNNYGKLEILSIDDANNKALTIKAVTYQANGTIYCQTSSLVIRGTWSCDLDAMEESITTPFTDFKWERVNSTDTYLTIKNSALFAKYDF